MPPWMRYAGVVYFGLMMSGSLAPPDWGSAFGAPPPTAGPARPARLPTPHHAAPPRDAAEARERVMGVTAIGAPTDGSALPGGPDLLR